MKRNAWFQSAEVHGDSPMFGQPDPMVPMPGSPGVGPGTQAEFRRIGFVSLWTGTFASVEAAEEYFGIPDEIGVSLPPDAFAADIGLGSISPEIMEVNFEQVRPRPLRDLLRDATFAASFIDPALEAAGRQGISEAQGIALLFDFDYRLKPAQGRTAGPLRFIGAFPFVATSPRANLQPFQDVARQLGYPVGAVLFVIVALVEASKKRRQERPDDARQMSAQEFCEYLVKCRGEHTAAILRELGLARSEDAGRIMFGLVSAGLARREETDSKADFQGLYVLE
jgi:uncharacterized repeat protein (TIGR04138 family)